MNNEACSPLGTFISTHKKPKHSTKQQRHRIDVLCRQQRIRYNDLLTYIKNTFPASRIRTLQDLSFQQANKILSILSLPYQQVVETITPGEYKDK